MSAPRGRAATAVFLVFFAAGVAVCTFVAHELQLPMDVAFWVVALGVNGLVAAVAGGAVEQALAQQRSTRRLAPPRPRPPSADGSAKVTAVAHLRYDIDLDRGERGPVCLPPNVVREESAKVTRARAELETLRSRRRERRR